MNKLNNAEKALIYDECILESDRVSRQLSKLKSEYPVNIPEHIVPEIRIREQKLEFLRLKLESLFN